MTLKSVLFYPDINASKPVKTGFQSGPSEDVNFAKPTKTRTKCKWQKTAFKLMLAFVLEWRASILSS